jgi:hypothetical protein
LGCVVRQDVFEDEFGKDQLGGRVDLNGISPLLLGIWT